MQKVIILGTAHRFREPGKCSPDHKLREFMYSREICDELNYKLSDMGYLTYIDWWPADLDKTMQTPSVKLERSRELALRVNEVNRICDEYGKQNCLYVSIHLNAYGNDSKWHNASGWQVCVSPKASNKSKILANYLFDAASDQGLKMRQPLPSQKYWQQSLYVLNNTKCPAVLTENLFMDNQKDAEFLLSDLGRHTIERLHIEGIVRFVEYLNDQEIIDRV